MSADPFAYACLLVMYITVVTKKINTLEEAKYSFP